MLEHFDTYISAQKMIGHSIMAFGGLLIAAVGVVSFFGAEPLVGGLRLGLTICGFVAVVSGYGYGRTEEMLRAKQAALHAADPAAFRVAEQTRMQQVARNTPRIQAAFIAVIAVCLVVALRGGNGTASGVLVSFAALLVGYFIIESVSRLSIDAYSAHLTGVSTASAE
jgi:hypothetical protein